MASFAGLAEVEPDQAAAQILEMSPGDGWLDGLMLELSAGRSSRELVTVLEVWGMSQAEFASLMGVSRQAVGKWLTNVPSDRATAIADLGAATEILVHYVRRDRVAAVVRRPAAALGGHSLVDLVGQGDTAAVLLAVRTMFDFSHPAA